MLFNQSSSKKLQFFQMGWNSTSALYIFYIMRNILREKGEGERLGHENAKLSPFHFFGQLYTRSTSLTLYLHMYVPETRKHGDRSLIVCIPETREKRERLIAVCSRDQGTWRPFTIAGTRDLTNSPYLHVPISSFTVFTRYHKPGGTFTHFI